MFVKIIDSEKGEKIMVIFFSASGFIILVD